MIRKACFMDIPYILNLGNKYIEEEVKVVCHHSASWDAERAAHFLAQSLQGNNFLWVAIRDGRVVGFLWATTHELAPWNPAPVASDLLFYIEPEYRGTVTAMLLIKEYRAWAGNLGCVEARLSLASGINEERVGRAYDILGFKSFGTVFCHKYKEDKCP